MRGIEAPKSLAVVAIAEIHYRNLLVITLTHLHGRISRIAVKRRLVATYSSQLGEQNLTTHLRAQVEFAIEVVAQEPKGQ
jgi:hypothetical protein